MAIPSQTSITGSAVPLARISTSWLAWRGSRCCTKTKAMPESMVSGCSSLVNAARPPADEPMPTMVNGAQAVTWLEPSCASDATGTRGPSAGVMDCLPSSRDMG